MMKVQEILNRACITDFGELIEMNVGSDLVAVKLTL
jgi:hypothetical protein